MLIDNFLKMSHGAPSVFVSTGSQMASGQRGDAKIRNNFRI